MHLATIFILFLFLFGIPFDFLPFNSSKLAVLLLAGAAVGVMASGGHVSTRVNVAIVRIAFIVSFLVVASMVYPVLHGTHDYSVAYSYFVMLAESLVGAVLLYFVFLRRYSLIDLLRFMVIICVIQAIIVLAMYGSEPIRSFIFGLVDDPSLERLYHRYDGFRGLGLAASTTYDFAIFLSIGLIFISHLIVRDRDHILSYSFAWLLILVAVLMSGRMGWIGVLLAVAILAFGFRSHLGAVAMLRFILYLTILVGVVGVGAVATAPAAVAHMWETVLPFAFEIVVRYQESGRFTMYSWEHLLTMYFPIGAGTLLVGDGYWVNPDDGPCGYYMCTDAGYMRHVLFYGLGPSLLLYGMYLYGFRLIYIHTKNYGGFYLVVLALAAYFLAAHAKGAFLVGSGMNVKLFFILLVYSLVARVGVNSGGDSVQRGAGRGLS